MAIRIDSSAFKHNERIPVRHTGDGEDVSPPLAWSGIPAGTKELALIMDDPDAPTPQPWVHWVISKLPATLNGLPENVSRTPRPHGELAAAIQGSNSWEEVGYKGPAPPKGHGTHHYHFRLYALDTELSAQAGPNKMALLAAMDGHILDTGELIGTYAR
ncbi:MAG TPA: YbhB/YbcL family Raf kinase inhibitor-like protein [Phycisphaerae bacterium]|jgi:hypothetical protein